MKQEWSPIEMAISISGLGSRQHCLSEVMLESKGRSTRSVPKIARVQGISFEPIFTVMPSLHHGRRGGYLIDKADS
jgi:hypothetical protein